MVSNPHGSLSLREATALSRIAFFPLAVSGLPDSENAILARQSMRLLAQATDILKNWDGTFFPLVQEREGRRVFLTLDTELPFGKMLEFIPSDLPVDWICCGTLSNKNLTLRIFSTTTNLLFKELDLKLPLDSLNLLQGLYFKFWEALDLSAPVPRIPQISKPASTYWLAARDRLLALELGIKPTCDSWFFEAALQGLDLEPGNPSLIGYLVRTAWIAISESKKISHDTIAKALGQALQGEGFRESPFSQTARELFFKVTTSVVGTEGQKNPEAMAQIAKKAISFSPKLPEAWYLWGLGKSKQSKPRAAIRALKKALSLHPGMEEARSLLGACYLSIEQPELAYQELKSTLNQGAKSYGLLLHLAQACSLTQRREEGLRYIQQAKSLAPDRTEAERVKAEFF